MVSALFVCSVGKLELSRSINRAPPSLPLPPWGSWGADCEENKSSRKHYCKEGLCYREKKEGEGSEHISSRQRQPCAVEEAFPTTGKEGGGRKESLPKHNMLDRAHNYRGRKFLFRGMFRRRESNKLLRLCGRVTRGGEGRGLFVVPEWADDGGPTSNPLKGEPCKVLRRNLF